MGSRPINIGTAHWQLELDSAWQDCSQEDLLRFIEPVSETVLTLSSTLLPEGIDPALVHQHNQRTLDEQQMEAELVPLDSRAALLLAANQQQVVGYVQHPLVVILLTLSSNTVPMAELLHLARSMAGRIRFVEQQSS